MLEAVSSAPAGDAPEAVDLRHLYDHEDRSVFVDWVHTDELGARLAAAAIYRQVRAELAGAAR
jgi:hypothetical protein